MHYALIAAGEGSRLKEEGVNEPKPLVRILGLPMIERLIRIFMRNGARSISVICNEQMHEVQDFLCSLQGSDLLCAIDTEGKTYSCQLNIVVKTTPSSMHSLAELSKVIPEGRFCLTTVDTIFSEKEFSKFIRAFATQDKDLMDGLFAVTPFVDDEKPLWVTICPQKSFSCACASEETTHWEIAGFYDKEEHMPRGMEKTVSGGIYCLDTRSALPVLFECLSQGQSRMRNFQRALIASGLKLEAYVFPKIMDIDHASDIEKAETWLQSNGRRILAITRDPVYSPNNENIDAAIFDAVLNNFQKRDWHVDKISEADWQQVDVSQMRSGYDLILHMTRSEKSLGLLEQLQIPVINMPESVRTVAKSRTKTYGILQLSGVKVPNFLRCDLCDQNTSGKENFSLICPAWIKVVREDGVKPEDVSFYQNLDNLRQFYDQQKKDQVLDVVVTEHIEGELIKCYAVFDKTHGQLRLLKWFRPLTSGYSKFGSAEQHNNVLDSLSIDERKLASLACAIGGTLDLQIFGFDMIVNPEDDYVVIDVNDWPSFSMCQGEAAEAIAAMVDNMF